MKGFGGFGPPPGNGGPFSSSSNLSPLAPPFTVDPSFPRPRPNPLVHIPESNFLEQPSYSFAARPPHNTSFPSPNSNPNPNPNLNLGINPIPSAGFPSTGGYNPFRPSFYDPQSISRPYTYQSQFPSPGIQDSGASMFSTSGVGPTAGGFWNGSSSGEPWKRKDMNVPTQPTYAGMLNQDFGIASIQHHLSGVEPLNESNYVKWRSQIDIILGHLEYDVALVEPKPDEPVYTAPEYVKEKYQKWTKANRMCNMIIRGSLSEIIRGGIPETDSAKELMDIIQAQFIKSTKPLIGNMICQLCTMRFYGQGSVREHILQMANLVCRLRDLKMELNDDFLVHIALNSLPEDYNTIKVNYYSVEQKWNVNELIAHCVQEEVRLRQEKVDVSRMKTLGVKKMVFKKSGQEKGNTAQESKQLALDSKQKNPGKMLQDEEIVPITLEDRVCFVCKMKGHMAKDCIERKHRKERKNDAVKNQRDSGKMLQDEAIVPLELEKVCRLCKMKGHVVKDCGELWRLKEKKDGAVVADKRNARKKIQGKLEDAGCFFCKMKGHFKKDCVAFKQLLEVEEKGDS